MDKILRPLNFLCVIVFALITIASCCGTQLTPEEQAYIRRRVNTPVICENKEDCDVKWGKAIYWVSTNSYWKFQIQTDNTIHTFGPAVVGGAGDTTKLAYQVNKVPLGDGRYQIVMRVYYSNPLGCFPDPMVAISNCYNYIDQ